MKVIAATKNKGKIREMQEILSPLDIEIISQQEIGIDVDAEETGDTFERNALIKARAVAMTADFASIAWAARREYEAHATPATEPRTATG